MAGRDGLRGAWELCQAAGLKPPENRDATSRVWNLVFSTVEDGELIAAALAHVSDHKQGIWWPKPADLMRHVQSARSVEEVRRVAIESAQSPALILEDMEHRRAERDRRHEKKEILRIIDERIQRDRTEAEKQALEDGLVYGPMILRLARFSSDRLESMGECQAPRGDHLHWHQSQTMSACPFRTVIERRRRTKLTLVGDSEDFEDVLNQIAGVVEQ